MDDDLIGLIPAAGKGVRLGLPYPKELYPIIKNNRYKPVSQYVLENMTSSGIHDIVFVINETKHQLIGFFGNGRRFNCNISYVVQEPRDDESGSTSPGLGDALDSAYHLIKDKTVCFGMADTIMKPNDAFRQVLDAGLKTDEVILGLFSTHHPEKFGMVELDDQCRVIKIDDKPKITKLVFMWGFILWRPSFTEHLHQCIENEKVKDFAQVMNLAIKRGLYFRGVPLKNSSYSDLGTYEEILELERHYRS